jgi:hypothetical protein
VICCPRKEPKQSKKPYQRLDNQHKDVCAYLSISSIPACSVVIDLLLKGETVAIIFREAERNDETTGTLGHSQT